jgi:hypothetical protein
VRRDCSPRDLLVQINARAQAEGEEAVFTLKVLRNGAGRREGVRAL